MKKNVLPFLLIFSLLFGCKNSDPDPAPEPVPPQEVPPTTAVYTATLGQPKDILLSGGGYNPRNFVYNNPWTNNSLDQKFQLGLVNSEANFIRYPGGTFGNFWNYRNDRLFPRESSLDPDGWVDTDKVENAPTLKQIKNNDRLQNSVNDLKFAAKGGTSGKPVQVVFQMNMVTPGKDFYTWKWGREVNGTVGSTDWYAMLDDRYERFKSMLLRAKSGPDPINVQYIELGNEYYFQQQYVAEAFPDGAAHGTACNYIAQKLKSDPELNLPNNAVIAATASNLIGGNNRRSTWNVSLASTLNRSHVDFITLHIYKAFEEPSVYTEEAFQGKVTDWFKYVDNELIGSNADASFLKNTANWRVWYTETNANWDGSVEESTSASEFKWGQTLVEAFSVLYLYERGNAALVLQFQFNNLVIPNTNGELYNRGLVLKPYMKACKGATAAATISFSETTVPKLPNSTLNVVLGQCFVSPAGHKKLAIINLSGAEQLINLGANVFTGGTSTLKLEGVNHTLSATTKPTEYTQTFPKAKVVLKPYSMNYIYE